MLKKIAISFCAVIVAIFALVFWQIDRFHSELTHSLNEKQVTFSEHHIHFFPQPEILLSNVKWQDKHARSVSVANMSLQSDFWSLLAPQKRIKQVRFEQMNIEYSGQQKPDLVGVNGQIEGDFLIDANQIHLANVLLTLRFAQPLLFNTQQLDIALNKGLIKYSSSDWQMILDDIQVNGERFVFWQLDATKQPMMWSITSEMHYADSQPQLRFNLQLFNKVNAEQRLTFVGENIALTPWQKMLNLPHLFSGQADIAGELLLTDNKTEKGQLEIKIPAGQFNGLNLLALVTKYLPIHYDETRFASKEINTTFQHLQSSLAWDSTRLNLAKLTFQIDQVGVTGQGVINLNTMNCDVTLNVGLTVPQYQHFSLPIRFFDSCYSPQYKVEFKQHLRHQLKNLIKEKLR
ncbi:hypothetical protein ACNO7O_08485 [Bisgaard Taxon 45]